MRSGFHRVWAAMLAVMVVAGCAVVASAGPAAAGGKSGSASVPSSLTLVVLDSPDGLPHHGGQVTFAVSTTVTDRPFVKLDCYQDGAYVYWSSVGLFPDYPWTQNFTLNSNYWTGGAADCVATLFYSAGHNKFPTLATLPFRVEA